MFVNPLPLILVLVGGYLLVRLRFFFILHPFRCMGSAFRALRSSRAKRSFFLALSGTLGVGNIFGVCMGLIIGGAGSVFWMLVSVLFSSVIKYSEVVLSGDSLKWGRGGMYYVIRSVIPRLAKPYAVGTVALSLVMGAAIQCHSVCESAGVVFGAEPLVCGLCLLLPVFLAIAGGGEAIKRVASVVIPIAGIAYFGLAVALIFCNIERLPGTIQLIMADAFDLNAVSGGIVGFLFGGGLKEGFSRGLMSNEAGAGTSSVAHSDSGILNPAVCGLVGILEVVVDTALLCTLTGVAVLCAVPELSKFNTGMDLIISATYNSLGSCGVYVLFASVLCFAFSTVICWYHYGREALKHLTSKRGLVLFLPIYILSCFLGVAFAPILLISVSDIILLFLTFICCFVLIKSSDRIKTLSELGGVLDRKKRWERGLFKEI